MLQNLTPLPFLNIRNCPKVVSSLEGFLTPNFKFLVISECQNTKIPRGLHQSGQIFLPHLSTIFTYIIHFQNSKSVASMGFKSLVSLETLLLEDCLRLRSVVTKGGLPLMLAELQIKDCSILKGRCLKNRKRLAQDCLHRQCPNTWKYTTII